MTAADEPIAPTNVRIAWGDTEFPVDVTYAGIDDEGMHQWAAPVPAPPPGLGPQSVMAVRVAMLPARTTIVLVPPVGEQ